MSIEEHRRSAEVLKTLTQNTEENSIDVDFSLTDEVSYILGVLDGDVIPIKVGLRV